MSKILLGLFLIVIIILFVAVSSTMSGTSIMFLVGSVVVGCIAFALYDLFFKKG